MTILQFPDRNNRIYKWTRQYILRKKRHGPQVAIDYLRGFVPAQIHAQVIQFADDVIAKKRKNNK